MMQGDRVQWNNGGEGNVIGVMKDERYVMVHWDNGKDVGVPLVELKRLMSAAEWQRSLPEAAAPTLETPPAS